MVKGSVEGREKRSDIAVDPLAQRMIEKGASAISRTLRIGAFRGWSSCRTERTWLGEMPMVEGWPGWLAELGTFPGIRPAGGGKTRADRALRTLLISFGNGRSAIARQGKVQGASRLAVL